MGLDKKLKLEIEKRGISEKALTNQLLAFIKGTPCLELDRIATVNDGIEVIDGLNRSKYMSYYNVKQKELSLSKFTPSSGLATRMFKSLLEFYDTKINNPLSKYFFNNLHKFPFYKDVIVEFHSNHPQIKKLDTLANKLLFLDFLLNEEHLNYKNTPKGLIKFHQYDIDNKTAIEEQIDESVHYCAGEENIINLHFTVNPNFIDAFKAHTNEYIQNNYLDTIYKFDISFSVQKSSTDTIAVTNNNTPYKNEDGDFLFRAGGHGALIENLNDLNSDIIFIKNIDNISHQNHIEETIKYKQILAGKLLKLQEKIFHYLSLLSQNSTSIDLNEIADFLSENFFLKIQKENRNKEYLFNLLNRPIRICGMIKNQGDPGGGPFWVKNKDNTSSLQIVEAQQINQKNLEQQEILFNATHFNPVDIVCGVKDFEGNKFDLTKYVDKQAIFISNKTVNGRPIKALELPGLWNGAMHNWLSVFVEVPIDTFTPVKTVTDLLSPMHQA